MSEFTSVWYEEFTSPDYVAVCPFCKEFMKGDRMPICIHAHGGVIFAHDDCAIAAADEFRNETPVSSGDNDLTPKNPVCVSHSKIPETVENGDTQDTDMLRRYGASLPGGDHCHAARDGECFWPKCPQERDGEPTKSGRHCPLDR